MKKIILNWLPPSMANMPAPSMSVLKAYLTSKGYDVSILYWNIKLHKLQADFIWHPNKIATLNEFKGLLLFYNYLAIKSGDKNAYAKVKASLLALKPQYSNADYCFFDRHMKSYACKLEEFINDELNKLDFTQILYVGFSVNLYQWICGSIIAQKIKAIAPNMPIVIGGIGTKESAVAFLENFRQFDIALWGEGENSLTLLTKLLNHEISDIKSIPNIAIRQKKGIFTQFGKNEYADLNSKETEGNFDDYFEQLRLSFDPLDKTYLGLYIENSRSCHWRKCKFCYLNTGYKHRLRDVDVTERYIRSLLERYDCTRFSFLDNDVIANDWEHFSKLLDCIIAIKRDYPNFQIVLAEIITKGITKDFIRKMALAGFTHVQIGYESASNTLLRKIDKKNTFASNLLFIKYALKYDIRVGGANVICGLLEETDADILEAIENLRYLRFFFLHGSFQHSMSRLGILHSSRYFHEVKENASSYVLSTLVSMLPEGYINEAIRSDCTIREILVPYEKETWTKFRIVEKYYLSSRFEYKLYKGTDSLIYKEYLNGELINALEIENTSLEYLVLKLANDSVCDYETLKTAITSTEGNENITDCEIFNILEDLKKEGLIYSPSDFKEIVSVIDMDALV